MHCSETWINLIYIDFYTLLTLISYRKLVPNKAEIPGREGESKSYTFDRACVPELRLLANRIIIKMVVASQQTSDGP